MSILGAYFYQPGEAWKTLPCLVINEFLILNFSHYFQFSLNIGKSVKLFICGLVSGSEKIHRREIKLINLWSRMNQQVTK